MGHLLAKHLPQRRGDIFYISESASPFCEREDSSDLNKLIPTNLGNEYRPEEENK